MTTHFLPANAETVRVGVIDQAFKPVLHIDDGDELILQTWGLWGNAVKPGATFEEVVELRRANAGKGPHSLTGPVAVRGAKAGMTLRVDVLELELGNHGYNLILPTAQSRGLLADDFAHGELRHFHLDTRRMTTELCPGVTLPLRPFLGIMGVAPATPKPHISSVPGPFGGNIDCPELVAGSTLFLPVWVDDALFYAGDAHAMQGCGEVNQTALETTMERAHLRISIVPNCKLERPYVETREHIVTMGFHEDLREAARQAVRDMVSRLVADYGFTRSDAYVLCSLQVDLMITQLVNGNNGVHARVSKALLRERGAS